MDTTGSDDIISVNNFPDMLALPAWVVSFSAFGAVFVVPDRAAVAFGFAAMTFPVFLVAYLVAGARTAARLEAAIYDLPAGTPEQRFRARRAIRLLHDVHGEKAARVTRLLLESITVRGYLRGVTVSEVVERAKAKTDPDELAMLAGAARTELAHISA